MLHLEPEMCAYPLTHYDRDDFTVQPAGENAFGPSGVTFLVGLGESAMRVTIEYLDLYGQGTFVRKTVPAKSFPGLRPAWSESCDDVDADGGIHVRAEGESMSATVGEKAPEFSLPGTTGPGLDLAELCGKGRAALFFYPADRTAG